MNDAETHDRVVRRAEERLLGGILVSPGAIERVNGLLPGDFATPAHAEIWGRMLTLVDRGAPISQVALWEELQSDGLLEKIGGFEYLERLERDCPSVAYIEADARQIRRWSCDRALQAAARKVAAEPGDEKAQERLATAQRALAEVGEVHNGVDLEVIGCSGDRLRGLREEAEPESPLPGLLPSEPTLCGLISQAELGKTTFQTLLGCAWATGEAPWEGAPALPGDRVLFVSAEMTTRRIWERGRRMAGEIEVGSGELAYQRFRSWEDGIVIVGKENQGGRHLRRLDADGRRLLRRVLLHAREVDRRRFGLVLLDSFQRLKPESDDSNANDDMTAMLDDLLQIAIDTQTYIVLTHHTGHEGGQRDPSRAGRGGSAFGDVTQAQWLLKADDPFHRVIEVEGNDVARGRFRFRVAEQHRPYRLDTFDLVDDDPLGHREDDLRDLMEPEETWSQSEVARQLSGFSGDGRPGSPAVERAKRAMERGIREGFLQLGSGSHGAKTVRRIQ